MIGTDALRAIMADEGLNQAQVAKLVGMKNQSNVSEALKRDMKISLFAAFADAMGYEVIIQKKKKGPKPDGAYVITKGGGEK